MGVFPTDARHFLTPISVKTIGIAVSHRVEVQKSDLLPIWPDILRICHVDPGMEKKERWWKLPRSRDARVDRTGSHVFWKEKLSHSQ